MKKEKKQEVLAGLLFFFTILPALTLANIKSHHDCLYDECMRIFANDKFGWCVEGAIDTGCFLIWMLLWFVIIGGAIILSKDINALSPFVSFTAIILFAVFLACIDPSKWIFVISLLPSFVLFIILVELDRKERRMNKK